ncbi:MAG: ABC transporter substrate-binding protein [Candidatus Thermochlorobacter sp.]
MKVFVLFSFAVCTLFWLSCSQPKETKHTEKVYEYRIASGGKVYGGPYAYAELQPLTTLDPVQLIENVSQHAAHQLYDLLIDLDPTTLSPVPELAESWEISDDGLFYTFTLRDSVFFHNDRCFPQGVGRKLTAADVKYSFERVCHPATQTKGFWVFRDKVEGATEFYEEQLLARTENRQPKLFGVRGFEVLSERRFRIRLTKPFAPFLMTLASAFCYIIPREAVDYYGANFTKHPVGTGPFMFEEFGADFLKLKRNPRYWQKDTHGNALPYLDEITLYFSRSEPAQLAALQRGEILEMSRFSSDIRQQVLPHDTLAPDYQERFRLFSTPSLSVQFCGMNCALPPFNDVRVRQAFSLALHRAEISKLVIASDEIQASKYAATRGLVPPALVAYDTTRAQIFSKPLKSDKAKSSNLLKLEAFNPDKARALLASAGYPDGKGFPTLSLYYDSTNTRNRRLAEFIQTSLHQHLNITIRLAPLSWSEHLEKCESGRAAFFLLGWVADYPEPENFLNLLYGKFVPADTSAISYPNMQRYRNANFDALFEQALLTLNDSLRYRLYAEAEALALNDAPLLLLVYDRDEKLLSKDVQGYALNAMDRRDLKYVWLSRAASSAAMQ